MNEFRYLLEQYGLWAVGVGAFFQGYLFVLIGGIMASQNLFRPEDVLLVAISSAWTGHWFLYTIGYWFSRHRDLLSGSRFQKPVTALDHTIRFHPWMSIFLMQYGYGIRLIGAIAFGFFKVRKLWFAWAQLLNCSLWALILFLAGFFAGKGFYALPAGNKLPVALAVTALLLLMLLMLKHWRNGNSLRDSQMETIAARLEKESVS